jgi:hypothetical protein
MASLTTRGSLPRCQLEKSFGRGGRLPYAIFCRADESALAGNVGQCYLDGQTSFVYPCESCCVYTTKPAWVVNYVTDDIIGKIGS